MSSFEQSLDSGQAQAWRPDQGGEDNPNPLIGKFIEAGWATTAYGPCVVATIRLEDGSERAVWLMHTVLKNEFSRAAPEPGETVGIKYLGKLSNNGGQEYVGYRVRVKREQGKAFNWTQVGEGPPADNIASAPNPEPVAVTVPAGAGDDGIPF